MLINKTGSANGNSGTFSGNIATPSEVPTLNTFNLPFPVHSTYCNNREVTPVSSYLPRKVNLADHCQCLVPFPVFDLVT